MLIEFGLQNSQGLEENIAARVPSKLGIVPPFGVQTKPFKTPTHASVETSWSKSTHNWPSAGQVQPSRGRITKFQGWRLIGIDRPQQSSLEGFGGIALRRHARENF